MASKFRFRTIWFRKGHENDSMQKITFNGPNFLWNILGVFGIHRLITIIILFTNFTNHIVLNRNCDAVDLAPSEDF